MTDWKPVNPCDGCDASSVRCECFCRVLSEYNHEVFAQRKLLEYLIATASGGHLEAEYDGFDRDAIGLDELESMLKELEEKK